MHSIPRCRQLISRTAIRRPHMLNLTKGLRQLSPIQVYRSQQQHQFSISAATRYETTTNESPSNIPTASHSQTSNHKSQDSSFSGRKLELPAPPPQRWITDLRSRVGKCIIFGCTNQQVSRAAAVLRALAVEWKDLLAGSEGFLTGGRRGLDSQKIAWGEMDSFVSFSLYPIFPLFHFPCPFSLESMQRCLLMAVQISGSLWLDIFRTELRYLKLVTDMI